MVFGHLEAFYLNSISTSRSTDNGLSRESSKTQLQCLNNKIELIYQKVGKICLTTQRGHKSPARRPHSVLRGYAHRGASYIIRCLTTMLTILFLANIGFYYHTYVSVLFFLLIFSPFFLIDLLNNKYRFMSAGLDL